MLDTCQTCETPEVETQYEAGVRMCQDCLDLIDEFIEEQTELEEEL